MSAENGERPRRHRFDALIVTARAPGSRGTGPHAEMVLSTRIRLARNLQSVPFTHRAREEQLQGVLLSVASAAQRSSAFRDGLLLRMNEMTSVERQILVERHLVSHELGDGARPRGIVIGPDERLSLMINEEDHLRLQSMAPGFQLAEAWAQRRLGRRRARPVARLRLLRGDRLPHLVPDQRRHRAAGVGADPPARAGAARGDPEGAQEHHAGRASTCAASTASTAR